MMEMAKYDLIIALSLTIYFARLNQGVWKDKIITFSSEPYFIDFTECKSLCDCLNKIPCINENTDINKVLNTAIKHHVPAENMVKNIIIISDMQFDIFDAQNQISFTNFIKEKYKKAGYEMRV